jgi:UDP-GlcNAc:undecaprenyl-phosphate GlcNAc-1-phosphate transferase
VDLTFQKRGHSNFMPFRSLHLQIAAALIIAFILSFCVTPLVKRFAHRVGAIDIPKDARRVHTHPIPRLGGLAIFIGFLCSVALFADISVEIRGILFGAVLIVALGVIDDMRPLPALLKFVVQIAAALIAVFHGVNIEFFANPFALSNYNYVSLGVWAIPVTVLWIVGITNSVNLIDGLDGLAVGVSAISSIVMLVIAVLVADTNVAIIMAALAGACLGFIPFNFNPAKIFMGDAGALLLGFVLATVSILGLFKFYAVISFAVPFLVLALPFFDTAFAFLRRLSKGKNPMAPDRGHFHHRLLDMGLSQKQVVAILYAISGLLGLIAVVISTTHQIRGPLLIAAIIIAAAIVFCVFRRKTEDNNNED